VRDYLAGEGIDPDRLDVAGSGEDMPVRGNDTPEQMAENRRVEFTVQ
jgi:outer membrane protein OmpA-like peptidoglycan-associated protein